MTEKKSEENKPVEKVEAEAVVKDDEPSWYHYLIVLVFFGLVIGGVYYGYGFYESWSSDNPDVVLNNTVSQSVFYDYPYKVGNVTYNIKFHSSVSDIESMSYVVEPSRIDVLNTISVTMSFLEYNGTDNGYVTVGSTKLLSFLRGVYHFSFDSESFKMYNETDCSSSTVRDKVVVFNPYANETGVFMSENGCVEFLSESPDEMVDVVDKFIYTMIEEDLRDD